MKKLIIILLPLLFITTGCWNYRELNRLAIATAMSIDKDGDDYKVSLLIANSKNASTSTKEGQSQTVIYTGTGDTISRAIKRINLQIPKEPYLGHLGSVIVSESVAKEGLLKVLDFLEREPESVKRFYLLLAKDDKAEDIIKILSPLETFPGQSIATNIKLADELEAISTSITYSKYIENLLKIGQQPSLPTISISGSVKKGSNNKMLETSDPSTITKLGTVAIFKEDKLKKITSEDESRGINLITGQVEEMIVTKKCNDGNVVINLKNINKNIEVKLKNNKPTAKIKISGTSSIQELTCDINIEDSKKIKSLEKEMEKEVKKQIEKAIKVTKKYKSDIFGFGNLLYKKNPNYFNKVKKIWDSEIYPDIKIDINVDITIKTKGSIVKSLKEG